MQPRLELLIKSRAPQQFLRLFSNNEESGRGANKFKCFISRLTDPWTNIAFEEWLFRDTNPQDIILYLWRNSSCVVIGRNQNPWKECNVKLLRNHDIPIIRRKSGGGTVFHDIGNTNYTLMMPRSDFTRKHTAELVVQALTTKLNIPAYVTERYDIAINGLKVSGSAFKLIAGRAYHHGTMLIDTDLDRIRKYLRVERQNLITKGVGSVPSPITNLRTYSSTVNHESFCQAVKNCFTEYYCDHVNSENTTLVDKISISKIPKVIEYREEHKTWDWIFGQTPEFTFEFKKEFEWGHMKALFKSKNGVITAVTLTPSHSKYYNIANALEDAFEGCKYGDEKDIDNLLNDVRVSEQLNANIGNNICSTLISVNEAHRVINDLGKWIKESL